MKIQRVISIHEYQLKEGITEEQFETAVAKAREQNLFRLPGLERYHFLKRIRGTRQINFVSIWIYDSKISWINLWGNVNHPLSKEDYPRNWKIWEDEILKPLLVQEPDKINFGAYEEF